MSAKNRNKATKRSEQKAMPKAVEKALPKVSATVHAMIVEVAECMLDEVDSGISTYHSFSALLHAVKWTDADSVKAVNDDIKDTLGEMQFANACKLVGIINNARKVACGGKKNDKVIAGKGVPFMLGIVDSCTGTGALKSALCDAKPAALKDARGGNRSVTVKAAPDVIVKKLSERTALEAATNVLNAVQGMLKPSQGALIDQIDALIDSLAEAFPAPIVKRKAA